MRISIVVNNYNYARFVSSAVDSALAQTWPDTEVVVVDDGSTDNSAEILGGYGGEVIKLFKPNGGQADALNASLNVVSGDVIMFLDADDLIDAQTAERLVTAFSQSPKPARVQWALRTIDAEGKETGAVYPDPANMVSGNLSAHILRYRTHVWPAQSGNAYSAEALQKVMPIPTDFRLGPDLYLAETTALLGPVVSLPTPGGSYRLHGANGWAKPQADVANLHKRIEWTSLSHGHVRRLAQELGLNTPEDVREALDVAFISQRLASLRMSPHRHPVSGDSRLALTWRGMRAAMAHPHHRPLHKVKRFVWILGVGLGPQPLADRWIKRFYFS